MLDHFAALNKRSQAARKQAAKPEVGIFRVYGDRFLVNGTPFRAAVGLGSFKTHDKGHDAFWNVLQRNGIVPRDVEYDEIPRGRVNYDTRERKFYLFVDPCIKKNKPMMNRIEGEMHLPSAQIVVRLDSHYRCPGCKPKKTKEQMEQEEDDRDF
ncbi:MAG: hypothetical protein WAL75_04300 [Terracidiphilus sp.]